MKNSSMYTAVAAFLAFVGAAVYAVLFYLGYLPDGFLFAQTGVRVAIIVMTLLTLAAAYCGCKAKHCLHNSFACYGKAVIFAAVVTLCVSNLLLTLTTEPTVLYTLVLFVALFFWKFLLILWGFMLATSIPQYCWLDETCGAEATTSAETTTETAGCTNTCSTNSSGCCRTSAQTSSTSVYGYRNSGW